jgi:hypothetical protein
MAFLPVLSAVAGIAGSAMAAIGAKNTAESNANAATYNAQQGEIAAQAERDAAAADAEDRRRAGSAQRATAIAQRGASGVALAGTPLMVDEDIVGAIELDAARTVHRGEVSATQRENQARLDRASAKGYKKAGPISAGASLLGGLSQVRWG